MMIAAPITMVFGIIFAIREDVGLSVIMLVAIPILIVVLGIIISRMVPTFQVMQLKVDRVNAVLREQITGVRVVRAFVREPQEVERFAKANDDLTATSLRAGRLMSLMFPTVTLFISMSSVAVLWLGANRINSGEMELGSVVAYLSYLVQVLVAVVMLTFMVSMIPRAAVAAERITEVLNTDSSVIPPTLPITAVIERGTASASRTLGRLVRSCQTSRSGSPLGAPRPSSAVPAPASRPLSISCHDCLT
jgi:ATP-binding cassette subfamily B protein